jgi:alpha-D-ribose 1-methylphosphonate 5-triphosphate synthase subunit PhnG
LIPSWPCRISGTAYFNFVEKKVTRTTIRLERGKGSSGVT